MESHEELWISGLTRILESCSKLAGLPAQRSIGPNFDGNEWLWTWREFYGDDAVAADLRVKAELDETKSKVHVLMSSVVWPIERELRLLSETPAKRHFDIRVDDLLSTNRSGFHSCKGEIAGEMTAIWRDASRIAKAMPDMLVEYQEHRQNQSRQAAEV